MILNNQLDFIDEEILILLQNDSRISFLRIAEKLKVSNSLVHQRISKLKARGIIENFGIQINQNKLGYTTGVYMGIVLKEASLSNLVTKELQKIPEIIECDLVSGEYAIFVKIVATNNEHLRTIIYDKVHLINGVGSTNTFFSFSKEFQRSAPIRLTDSRRK
tara:strand:- start:3960 stop:4445 length:486 start_codon:yes stop_codon:yes gene_type:complete